MSGTGDAELDAMIARVRAVAEMPQELAADLARDLLDDVRRTAAAGTTHEGEPWPATKTGGRPLVHAAERLTARVLGTVVQIVLRGVEVIHNRGTTRTPARRILPDAGAGLPPRVATIARAAATRAFERATRGGL